MISENKLNMILNRVEKPSRYIGNEINTILKDDSNERVSMAFFISGCI